MLSWWLFIFLFLVIVITTLHWVTRPVQVPVKTGQELYDQFQSGDIILFRTHSRHFYTKFQMFSDRSSFSHAGVIYRSGDQVYIFETHQKTHDVNRKPLTNGYHLYPILDRIKNYRGILYYRAIPSTNNVTFQHWLTNFVHSHLSKKDFPSNRDLLLNYLRRCWCQLGLSYPLNCSELVAVVLQQACPQLPLGNLSCLTPGGLARLPQLGPIIELA